MRTVVSLIAAVLAGVLAILAGAGALVDEAAHRPAMIRGLAETVAADPRVRAAVPGAVTDSVEDALPDQLPDALVQVAEDVVEPVAESVAQDPDVARGWADTADQARRAWLDDLADARTSPTPVPGGEFTIPFGPVAQTGLAAALGDAETRLRGDEYNVPGQEIVERLLGVDFGDWAADTLLGPLYERAAHLRDSTELRMTFTVDALRGADRAQVARAVDASAHWVWAAVAAGVLLLVALVTAPHRRRGLTLLVAGAVVAGGGFALRTVLGPEDLDLTAPEGATPGLVALVRSVEEALTPALTAAVDPYPAGLLTVGAVTAAAGVVVLLVELAVRPRRARH